MLYDNNHLIYDEKGNTVHFFHTNTDGLCMKAGAGVQTLLKEAYADFDLCRCGGALHIVCQSMDGDLLYLKYIDEKWHKYTLLVSKTKGAYDKHFFLLPTGNCIQLFYTLRSGGKHTNGPQNRSANLRPFFLQAEKRRTLRLTLSADSTSAVCPEKKSFISSAHWTKHFPKHHGFPFRRTAVASFPICALKKIKFILYGNRNAAFCTRQAKTTARPSARLCACCRPALTRYCFPCTKTIRARARLATFSMEKSNFTTLLRRVCSRLCSNIPPLRKRQGRPPLRTQPPN